MTETNRNSSVDVFRLLAALCVVILHVSFESVPRDLATGLRLMSRWAIPFFFMVSGYFLAERYARTGSANIQAKTDRLLWLFLVWVVLYAPFVVWHHDLETLFKLTTAPAFIYFGFYSHLWYLPSLFFGSLFVTFCMRHAKPLLPVISIISIGMALISGAYNIFDVGFRLDYEVARTWLSIPFLYAGMLLFEKGKPAAWVSIALVLGGAASQIFEARWLYQQYNFSAFEHQFLIGTIPFAIGMTGLAFRSWKFFQHPLLSKWGAEYSLGVYLIHPAVLFTVIAGLQFIFPALARSVIWQTALPLTVMAIALAFLIMLRHFAPAAYRFIFGAHIARQTPS